MVDGFIIIGRPGSGKSTVGRRLAAMDDRLGFFSAGDIAREMIKSDAYARLRLRLGMTAPEQKMRDGVYGILNSIRSAEKVFILDGFPRFLGQWVWLSSMFNVQVISINTSMDTCISRINGRTGRNDASKSATKRRMKFFDNRTLPMWRIMRETIGTNEYFNEMNTGLDDLVHSIYHKVVKPGLGGQLGL